MSGRILLIVLVLLDVASGARRGSAASAKAIRAGDPIVVTIGPAPVECDGEIVARLAARTELKALEVKGNRVKVSIDLDGRPTEGWIRMLYLKRAAPAPSVAAGEAPKPRPAAQPSEKEAATPAARAADPLSTEASALLDRALKGTVYKEGLKRAAAMEGICVGTDAELDSYTRVSLQLGDAEVKCWNVGRSAKGRLEDPLFWRGARLHPAHNVLKLKSIRMTGVVLYFPEACALGQIELPAQTLVRRTAASWERITTPDVLARLAARAAKALLNGNSSGAEVLRHLGPAAEPSVPTLIKALAGKRRALRQPLAECLEKITGQNFGEDPAKWRQWWESRKNQ